MDEISIVPQSQLEMIGDTNPDSVDLDTLKACFPEIFASFAELGEWQILAALEGACMDEKRATRNLKAKIKQTKNLGVGLAAAERIQNQKYIQKREAVYPKSGAGRGENMIKHLDTASPASFFLCHAQDTAR